MGRQLDIVGCWWWLLFLSNAQSEKPLSSYCRTARMRYPLCRRTLTLIVQHHPAPLLGQMQSTALFVSLNTFPSQFHFHFHLHSPQRHHNMPSIQTPTSTAIHSPVTMKSFMLPPFSRMRSIHGSGDTSSAVSTAWGWIQSVLWSWNKLPCMIRWWLMRCFGYWWASKPSIYSKTIYHSLDELCILIKTARRPSRKAEYNWNLYFIC